MFMRGGGLVSIWRAGRLPLDGVGGEVSQLLRGIGGCVSMGTA
jgi:hypothetical protein